MSENPVKLGDGYATVTGYRLPHATGLAPGRRERGFKPEVRIPVCSRSSRLRLGGVNFSVKEKDEASSVNCFRGDVEFCLHSPFAGV